MPIMVCRNPPAFAVPGSVAAGVGGCAAAGG